MAEDGSNWPNDSSDLVGQSLMSYWYTVNTILYYTSWFRERFLEDWSWKIAVNRAICIYIHIYIYHGITYPAKKDIFSKIVLKGILGLPWSFFGFTKEFPRNLIHWIHHWWNAGEGHVSCINSYSKHSKTCVFLCEISVKHVFAAVDRW
jgi:hypothetical protein